MTRRSQALPAGSWPVSELWPHVLLAGRSLSCSACGSRATTPPPRAPDFGAAIELFLARHRACAGEARP